MGAVQIDGGAHVFDMKNPIYRTAAFLVGAFFALTGCAEESQIKDTVVVCVDCVKTSSWQAFPVEDEKALPPAARSTVWGNQTFLVADKFVGSVGVGGSVRFAFFKRELKRPEDRAKFIKEMKKGRVSAVGFLSMTLDAPVVERGDLKAVTQCISYKLLGDNGRVWTAGTVRETVTGKRSSGDALLVEAVDAAVDAVARQLSMKMQH